MEVERNGNGIKIYSDVDRMLPLISMHINIARKLYSDMGRILAEPIQCYGDITTERVKKAIERMEREAIVP